MPIVIADGRRTECRQSSGRHTIWVTDERATNQPGDKQASKFIRQKQYYMTILIQNVNNTMAGYQKEILPSSWSLTAWATHCGQLGDRSFFFRNY